MLTYVGIKLSGLFVFNPNEIESVLSFLEAPLVLVLELDVHFHLIFDSFVFFTEGSLQVVQSLLLHVYLVSQAPILVLKTPESALKLIVDLCHLVDVRLDLYKLIIDL